MPRYSLLFGVFAALTLASLTDAVHRHTRVIEEARTRAQHMRSMHAIKHQGPQYHVAVHVSNGQVTRNVVFPSIGELLSYKRAYNPSATGSYFDNMNTTGWGQLHVNATNSTSTSDADKLYSVGYVEGRLTQARIWQQYTNVFSNWGYLTKGVDPKVAQFVQLQMDSVAKGQSVFPGESAQWLAALGLVNSQFQGLVQGYNDFAPADQKITALNMFILNAAGDMEDIRAGIKFWNMTTTEIEAMGGSFPMRQPRYPSDEYFTDCSALIRLTNTSPYVQVGHTTWRSYAPGFLRIYKFYTVPNLSVPSFVDGVGFASSPGFLSSKDDFYVTSSNLVTLETTNSVFNTQLYTKLDPVNTVFCWVRSIMANRMASDSKTWVDVFGTKQSGTYNNQWMAVDLNLVSSAVTHMQPGSTLALPANTLWILEQIPGATRSQDVTSILNKQGYWASYNIPFIPYIFDQMGYPSQVAKNGNASSYEYCPRANIFRRDAPGVNNQTAFQGIMRYCDYQNDPLSLGSPTNCISSRYDLIQPSQPGGKVAAAFGGIDSKMTTYELAYGGTMQAYAQSGPTHDQQTPFQWSTSAFDAESHVGEPDEYNFGWILVTPDAS